MSNFWEYGRLFSLDLQLRPYLVDRTVSRSISKVKLRRALLVLRLETTWEHQGAVVFYTPNQHLMSKFWEYERLFSLDIQLRPYLVDHTGSRWSSKVKLRR